MKLQDMLLAVVYNLVRPNTNQREGQSMELEAEEPWLRKRVVRLRTVLRYADDPRIEVILREIIADAENRLELLQASRGRPLQQQQQVQPKKRKVARPSQRKKWACPSSRGWPRGRVSPHRTAAVYFKISLKRQ